MKGAWIHSAVAGDLAAEGTTVYRVWSADSEWIERFGADYLISAPDVDAARALLGPLREWAEVRGGLSRIFARRLVKNPRESDVLEILFGPTDIPLQSEVAERGVKFGLDFGAGYSVGLFCDQRLNRAYLESLRPARVLNCFAYTCAFSVVAARVGAQTLSVDLSRKSLDRGRQNFRLNGLTPDGHRFLADDVFAVLPRLARRDERFDAIILDPPTFSRGAKGRVFRVEEDFGRLLELSFDVATKDARILLSTNAAALTAPGLRAIASKAGRAMSFHEEPTPLDFGVHRGAVTVWAELGTSSRSSERHH